MRTIEEEKREKRRMAARWSLSVAVLFPIAITMIGIADPTGWEAWRVFVAAVPLGWVLGIITYGLILA